MKLAFSGLGLTKVHLGRPAQSIEFSLTGGRSADRYAPRFLAWQARIRWTHSSGETEGIPHRASRRSGPADLIAPGLL